MDVFTCQECRPGCSGCLQIQKVDIFKLNKKYYFHYQYEQNTHKFQEYMFFFTFQQFLVEKRAFKRIRLKVQIGGVFSAEGIGRSAAILKSAFLKNLNGPRNTIILFRFQCNIHISQGYMLLFAIQYLFRPKNEFLYLKLKPICDL